MGNQGSMSLADSYFDCNETPLWFPDAFAMSSIQTCTSCVLRIVSKLAGPGNIQTISDRLVFQENPLTTLSVNGIQHNVLDSSIVFPGAHKLPGRATPCPAELIYQFQNTNVPNKYIFLHIPLDIGTGFTNRYFSTLTPDVRNDRPTLSALLSKDMSFVSFEGVSLRGRTASDIHKAKCDPPSIILTNYLCLSPVMIAIDDYNRLKTLNGTNSGPPKPSTPSARSDRIIKLCTLINGIIIESEFTGAPKSPYGVSTNAMKCVRLDKDRDIVGDKVYVDGKNKPGTTLSDELMYKDLNSEIGLSANTNSSIQPGDIEKILGIVLGIIAGLTLASMIAVFIYKFIYKDYMKQQQLYSAVTSTHT